MAKYSVSLTDDLAKEIKDRYPDTPFSTAIAKLVRQGLDANTTNATNPTPVVTTPGPEDITAIVRAVIQDEMKKYHPPVVPVISDPVIVQNPVVIHHEDAPDNTHEWLKSSEVAGMLPAHMPRGTKSARVSRAISSGKLKSNGEHGKYCRINRDDALAWIKTS